MEIKGKKVAIFGLGISGKSALRYAFQQGAKLTVVNQGQVEKWPQDLKSLYSQIDCLSQEEEQVAQCLAGQDLILLSPGIPREHHLLREALQNQVPIWSEIELAYRHFTKPIVAVTGTNGKTTTATMLAKALEFAGHKVFLGGNIGKPFLDYFLDNIQVDVAVLELSSFQLESLSLFRPRVALILNLDENHGERYSSMDGYALAKAQIASNMQSGDTLILGRVEKLNDFSWPEGLSVIHFPHSSDVDTLLKELFPMQDFQLPGAHNRGNLWFVYRALKALGKGFEGLPHLVREFRGVPHRLERLLTPSSRPSLKVFNDAKSTNWEATLTAVRAISEEGQKVWLICGGQRRGKHDYPSFDQIQQLRDSVEKILAIGESASLIAEVFPNTEKYTNLEEAWKRIVLQLKSGIVLFSPAFPSFDQYQNYIERGEHFKGLAESS